MAAYDAGLYISATCSSHSIIATHVDEELSSGYAIKE
jgi:hypothetical protein